MLRSPSTREANDLALQRFSKRLKRVTTKLPDLVKDEQASVRPGEFSWRHPWATSNQTCDREIVMRCAQRGSRYWGGATRC